MILTDILYDASFAAIAGVGFGAISDPPLKAFPGIAALSAIGHAVRFCLMHYAVFDIATASLLGALAIGFGSYLVGKISHCPMTVLSIPSLLPMVPGIFYYKTILSLIMFLRNSGDPSSVEYIQSLFSNFLLAFTTTFNLGIGVVMPHFLLKNKAYLLTRQKK